MDGAVFGCDAVDTQWPEIDMGSVPAPLMRFGEPPPAEIETDETAGTTP